MNMDSTIKNLWKTIITNRDRIKIKIEKDVGIKNVDIVK